MEISFQYLIEREEGYYLTTHPEITDSPWEPFPNFFKTFENRPGHATVLCPGYCAPKSAADGALIWAWLRWHLKHDVATIERNLMHTVNRGIQLHQTDVWEEREEFDVRIILCAILSGNRTLMKRAAESVWHASPQLVIQKVYPLYPSLTGILKYRILGQPKLEQEQAEIFLATGALPWIPLPGKALLRRFLERDYPAFNKQLKKDCERYTVSVQKEWNAPKAKTVPEKTKDRMVIDLRYRRGFRYWPYVETAFAKLAIMDGAEITYDSAWHPLDFVKHFS